MDLKCGFLNIETKMTLDSIAADPIIVDQKFRDVKAHLKANCLRHHARTRRVERARGCFEGRTSR